MLQPQIRISQCILFHFGHFELSSFRLFKTATLSAFSALNFQLMTTLDQLFALSQQFYTECQSQTGFFGKKKIVSQVAYRSMSIKGSLGKWYDIPHLDLTMTAMQLHHLA